MFELNEVLVPVDFSDASRTTLAQARSFLAGENAAIIILHVIDPCFADLAATNGLGSREDILRRMRVRAERELQDMAAMPGSGVEVTTVISEGIPFYEIVRRAEEFDVDAVLIGKAGAHDPGEALFFGSTADKVIRACKRPVVVLPTP